jgi:hypothetical protein
MRVNTDEVSSAILFCFGIFMSLDNVTPGNQLPHAFNVIIEIPMNADPVKYEVDKATGAIFVDRFMSTSMHYPTNYGYVPKTISGDGDPVDVLVMSQFALPPGVVVRCRPIGMLKMVSLPAAEAGTASSYISVSPMGHRIRTTDVSARPGPLMSCSMQNSRLGSAANASSLSSHPVSGTAVNGPIVPATLVPVLRPRGPYLEGNGLERSAGFLSSG